MVNIATHPDLLLARRAAKADHQAWDEIIERYGKRIYNIAYRFARNAADAEELTQEIFLKLYHQLGRYRGDAPLLAWSLRLSRNLCIDHYRQQRSRRQAETVDGQLLEHMAAPDDPYRDSHRRQQRAWVYQALSEMTDNQALLVILRDFQGLTYDELAQFFDVAQGTIKSRLNRARQELTRRLQSRLDTLPEAVGRDRAEPAAC